LAVLNVGAKRVQGTNAERIATSLTPAGSVAGWKELGRTKLTSSSGNYGVTGLDNKRYLMVLVNNINAGQVEGDSLRFNNDTTSNQHAGRYNSNGGSDGTITNKTKTNMFGFHPHTQPSFAVMNVANYTSKEKLAIIHAIGQHTNSSGSGNPPSRAECVAKYVNTSDPISSIQMVTGWSTFSSGSEMVVLGYDPADTNTASFWEELASVELSSAGSELSSGTFTAKKYLWIQAYVKGDGSSTPNLRVQVNGDTGSNYAERQSSNGGSDGTGASQDHFPASNGGKFGNFSNMFVINNASNEKLFIVHGVSVDTSGAGTAPVRREIAGKWDNTSDQITSIKIYKSTGGNYQSGSVIKVWGSD